MQSFLELKNELIFPIEDYNGKLVFNKIRNLDYVEGGKIEKFKNVYGSKATLYNSKRLNPKFYKSKPSIVVICAGEPDCIRLAQEGAAAVTSTVGEGHFKEEWVPLFEGVSVYICLDNDAAGIKGTRQKLDLFPKARVIILPTGVKDVCEYFKNHTIQEFANLPMLSKTEWEEIYPSNDPSDALIVESLTFKEVEEKVLQFIPNSSSALKLILAVAASASFKLVVLLWLLIVGDPSSGKTDLVRLIRYAITALYLDTFTLNAFVSGERPTSKAQVHDLLPLLDKKVFIVKDWTSLFSMDEKATRKILGDLVNIYDKEFNKFSSQRGSVNYASAFAHLGCITPATLNKHTQYLNMVGARILFYTMPDLTDEEEEESFNKIFVEQDRELLEKQARRYTTSYLAQITKKDFSQIKPLGEGVQTYLKLAAKFVANCRGIVVTKASKFKNEDGKEITSYQVEDVQIEKPWRAVHQLIGLSKFLAFVTDKDEVGVEELIIIREVVISSMPADRAKALKVIIENGGHITSSQLAKLSERSYKTSLRLLDELAALKVVEKTTYQNLANDYSLASKFKNFILQDTAEFLSDQKEEGGT